MSSSTTLCFPIVHCTSTERPLHVHCTSIVRRPDMSTGPTRASWRWHQAHSAVAVVMMAVMPLVMMLVTMRTMLMEQAIA